MTRVVTIVLLALIAAGCSRPHVQVGRRVVVLGVDGLDYQLVRRLIEEGRMPHFARLSSSGTFQPLASSIPPQSPVAWSSFITGLDPGRTQIFDFIHREPATMEPFLSTSQVQSGQWTIALGRWRFPLLGGRAELRRRGEPFWAALERHGVNTTIIRMPANFPPSGAATRELSGMGTPDMLGTNGTFSLYSSRPNATAWNALSGGSLIPVHVSDRAVRASIEGPDNPYLVEGPRTRAEFAIYLDQDDQFAKLVVGSEERLIRVGEWSDWVPLRFKLHPFKTLSGQCRFFLKRIAPYVELYVSPVNIDPFDPALPISVPGRYAAQVARATGSFYTQGMPEETKALKAGVLTADEFLTQARITAAETTRQLWYTLDRFDDGLLFYYFGHVDQVSHMMWRAMDPGHPAFTEADRPYRSVVEDLYAEVDDIVGATAARLRSNDVLVVMSDHGFSSWRRSFSVNSWLRDRGYLAVRDPTRADDPGLFSNVDWSRTRAYGLGLNALYINVRGREAHGIVEPNARESLAAEIAAKLMDTVDPTTGLRPIRRMFPRESAYSSAGAENITPDLIIGFEMGMRGSDESSLGGVPLEVLADNLSAWSGDHCVDPEVVPGVLLTNRTLQKTVSSLQMLAGALVAEFGIDSFPGR